jgi:hypothetical protein
LVARFVWQFNERNCDAAPVVPTDACIDALATANCMHRLRTTEPSQASCELNEVVCRIDALGIEEPSSCEIDAVVFDWGSPGLDLWTDVE